jgi:hypothetical protein
VRGLAKDSCASSSRNATRAGEVVDGNVREHVVPRIVITESYFDYFPREQCEERANEDHTVGAELLIAYDGLLTGRPEGITRSAPTQGISWSPLVGGWTVTGPFAKAER